MQLLEVRRMEQIRLTLTLIQREYIFRILGMEYKEQINLDKDACLYEVRRFLQLLCSGNPTMLELLYIPEDCILEKHPL